MRIFLLAFPSEWSLTFCGLILLAISSFMDSHKTQLELSIMNSISTLALKWGYSNFCYSSIGPLGRNIWWENRWKGWGQNRWWWCQTMTVPSSKVSNSLLIASSNTFAVDSPILTSSESTSVSSLFNALPPLTSTLASQITFSGYSLSKALFSETLKRVSRPFQSHLK